MSRLAGGYYRHLVYKGLARIYSCYNVEDSPFLQNYQAQNVTSAGVEKLWYKAKLTSKTKTNINFLLSCPSGCNTLNASPHHSQTIYGYFDRNISLPTFYPKTLCLLNPVMLLILDVQRYWPNKLLFCNLSFCNPIPLWLYTSFFQLNFPLLPSQHFSLCPQNPIIL